MTLVLQLVAVWSLLSVLVAVACSLLFKGADVYAARAARLVPVDADACAREDSPLAV